EELAGDERRGRLREVVATPPGGGQVGRDDAPMTDEILERRVAATREEAELPGEHHEAGDDQRQRDVRRPPRRVGVPQGDHGVAPIRASWASVSPSAVSRTGSGSRTGWGSRTAWRPGRRRGSTGSRRRDPSTR